MPVAFLVRFVAVWYFASVTFGGGWNSRTGGEPEGSVLLGEPATLRVSSEVEPVKASREP
jgi:hypothetical protein